jgi:DNA-directed RNA polymerase beta subunit
MPYTRDGIIPDLILSPLSVPTRMIVGSLIEMLMAKRATLRGEIVDGTSFGRYDIYKEIEQFDELLKKMEILQSTGIDPNTTNIYQDPIMFKYGYETLYNGRTGEKMKCMVFIGPSVY